ncbi:MAG: aspartate carbamoyltransferase regulatory subunit [Gammaproteobacteria bacterium]|nr:aspartate carbamoyltransferase regulatory subunit [Gammaproteobacteria bacterium]
MSLKYMKVEKIDHGTVIDHILPAKAFDVLRVLGLSDDKSMSILVNSPSKKGGRKDILKFEDVELSAEEANLVALVSPQATINIIVGGKVVSKFNAEAPRVVRGILSCSNPNCISNQNEPITTEFTLGSEEGHRYVCSYCEREIVDLAKCVSA